MLQQTYQEPIGTRQSYQQPTGEAQSTQPNISSEEKDLLLRQKYAARMPRQSSQNSAQYVTDGTLSAKSSKTTRKAPPNHTIVINKKRVNPFVVLGLNIDSDNDELKDHYRKLSLKFHPDKGGDVDKFNIIKECYKYLRDIIADNTIDESRFDTKVKKQEYNPNVDGGTAIDTRFDGKAMEFKNKNTVEKFNTMFKEYNEEVFDPNKDGYGEIMTDTQRNTSYDANEFANQSIDTELMQERQIIMYKEPESFFETSLGGSVLGQGKIDDFSVQLDNLHGCDYKKAHMTENEMLRPEDIAFQENRNTLQQYTSKRSSQKFDLTPEEIERYRQKRADEEASERERKLQLRQQDEMMQRLHSKYRNKMIENIGFTDNAK